jgi:hypothetical protein
MFCSVVASPHAGYPDLAFKLTFPRYAGVGENPLGSAILLLLVHTLFMNSNSAPCAAQNTEVVAFPVHHAIKLDATHPSPQWQQATPATFCADWQGRNADPGRQTTVWVLWSPDTLYLRFACRYRQISVFADSDANGRRDELWNRDVAEVFLQPDPSRPGYYREFEVSPNGMWIDLDIFPGGRRDLQSGLQRSVFLDSKTQTWFAELAIPMRSLTAHFDPRAIWRANFYRVEGPQEPRRYLAWQPTNTDRPNFHVPSAFGSLRFATKT